jgi:hypothetical protein
MEFPAGSSSSGVGGAASLIAGSSSSGAGGSLTLESGDGSTTGGSIAISEGSGANSLAGSVTIESGVGTATDSGAGTHLSHSRSASDACEARQTRANSRPLTNGKPHYVGIRNPGNACYVISLVQMMYRIYLFSDAVMSLSDDTRTLTERIESYLQQNRDHAYRPEALTADAVAKALVELKHLFVLLTESSSDSISITPFIDALSINHRVNGDIFEFFDNIIFFYICFLGKSQLFCGLHQIDCYPGCFSVFPPVQHEGQQYFPFNYLQLFDLKE